MSRHTSPAVAALDCFWNSTTKGKGARIPARIWVGHELYDSYRDNLVILFRERPTTMEVDYLPPEHPELLYRSARICRGEQSGWLIERWN